MSIEIIENKNIAATETAAEEVVTALEETVTETTTNSETTPTETAEVQSQQSKSIVKPILKVGLAAALVGAAWYGLRKLAETALDEVVDTASDLL